MKKVLGIAKGGAKVPEWLDREILATAALRARSFRQRRRIAVMLSSAAAAMVVAVGVWCLYGHFSPADHPAGRTVVVPDTVAVTGGGQQQGGNRQPEKQSAGVAGNPSAVQLQRQELIAMSDFSSLEQENLSLDALLMSYDAGSDYTI